MRDRTKLLRWAVITVTAVLVLAIPAVASATAQFAPAVAFTSLPSGALTTGSYEALSQFVSVSCTGPGNCVAVGYYTETTMANNDFDQAGMVAVESNGDWAAPSPMPLPSNASPMTSGQDARYNLIACATPGNCVAVGSYYATASVPELDQQTTIATETNGSWSARQLVLPTGANSGTSAEVQEGASYALACTGPGACLLTGDYLTGPTSSVVHHAMYAVETGGTWAQAQNLPVPSGGTEAMAAALGCASDGNCVAGGSYDTASGTVPWAVDEQSGSWGTPAAVGLPSNAAGPDHEAGTITSLSCPAAGACVGVGTYSEGTDESSLMALTQVGASWNATAVAPPASYVNDTADEFDFPLSAAGVSCPTTNACTAVGSYPTTAGPGNSESIDPMAFTQTGSSTWAQASSIALPSSLADSEYATMNGVSCAEAGYCTAVGSLLIPSGPDSSTDIPIAATSVATLAASGASLPAAAVGASYEQQLAATGGAGQYSWSVTSGALPAGLSLSSAGAISGAPTAAGTGTLTVTVTDPGPPAQTASEQLTITVAPAAKVARVKATVKGSKVKVSAVCDGVAGQTCRGKISMSTVEHLLGGRLTAVTASAGRRRRTRTLVLASHRYSAAAGSRTTVVLKLSKAGVKLLAKIHKLPVQVALTAMGQSKPEATVRATITAPKPRRTRR